MNRDEILLLLFPFMVGIPFLIMGLISKWRDEKADKEEKAQNHVVAN